jgi:hypothetical protein
MVAKCRGTVSIELKVENLGFTALDESIPTFEKSYYKGIFRVASNGDFPISGMRPPELLIGHFRFECVLDEMVKYGSVTKLVLDFRFASQSVFRWAFHKNSDGNQIIVKYGDKEHTRKSFRIPKGHQVRHSMDPFVICAAR